MSAIHTDSSPLQPHPAPAGPAPAAGQGFGGPTGTAGAAGTAGTAEATLEIHSPVTRPRRRRWIWATLAGLGLTCALGAGGAYAYHYQDLVLPNTTWAGRDISGLDRAQLRDFMTRQAAKLQVKTTGQGASEATLSLADLGFDAQVADNVERIMTPNKSFSQLFAALFTARQVEPVAKFDAEKLGRTALSLSKVEEGGVRQAAVVINQAGTDFEIDPGAPGLGVDDQQLQQAATQAWLELADQKVELQLKQVQPLPAPAQMQEWIAAGRQMISPQIRLTTPRGRTFVAEKADKLRWVSFPPAGEFTGGPQIDQAQVAQWLDNLVNEKVNYNAAKGKRQLTKDGQLLQLVSYAYASLKVTNAAELAQGIVGALEQGQDFAGKFVVESTPGEYEDVITDQSLPVKYQAAPGEKWISVDLTHNTTTAWEGDKVVFGPIPSVSGSVRSPTVVGTFKIYTKLRSQVMRGTGWDGPYESWAPWVMYFHGDYALHGAPWRSTFVYRPLGGSHGCVNLSTDNARWLFNWAPVGTTVVTYR